MLHEGQEKGADFFIHGGPMCSWKVLVSSSPLFSKNNFFIYIEELCYTPAKLSDVGKSSIKQFGFDS